MEYASEAADDRLVVRLQARLTFNDHAAFRAMIEELQTQDARDVIFDLTALNFIDSAGLGMLLIAREELQTNGRRFVLRGAQGQVRRVFDVARLSQVVTIET